LRIERKHYNSNNNQIKKLKEYYKLNED